jgi:hypothetical protein
MINNNTDITVDSNIIQNSFYAGIYLYYDRINSVSHNLILSRTANANNYSWYGIYGQYAPARKINGNRIKQRSNNISGPVGIYYRYQQNAEPSEVALITNNEIMLHMTAIGYGINVGYGRLKILHNSIYVDSTGAARGIHLEDAATNNMTVRNNNIVMTSSTAYPIYLTSVNNLPLYNIDYNNMYAPQYVGYVGGNKTNITDWQQTIRTDQHSVNINPVFMDNTIDLRLVYTNDMECPLLFEVSEDINNDPRLVITTMGCYQEEDTYTINARLVGLNDGKIGYVGINDSIKVILINTGTTALSTATLNWTMDGNTKSPVVVSWQNALAANNLDTITLGTVIPILEGNYSIKIWISDLGSLQDEFLKDDTVSISGYNCTASYMGNYTVGTGGDFTSVDEILNKIRVCGASGDITLELLPEIHQEDIDLANISPYMKNYTLTLTSSTGNASSTVIETQTAGIRFSNNSNNIVIRDITIDARKNKTYAIRFLAACDNVVITNCIILSDTAGVNLAPSYAPVYKENGTGVAHNVSITNNILEGGYYGILFYGGTATNSYGTNIIIDSKIISKQTGSGIYSNYTDFTSISFNRIISRTDYTSNTWNGVYLSYCNGNILNNRIIQQSNNIAQPYGIYVQYFNYNNAKDTSLIANNEMILNTTTTYGGISANASTRTKIIHNSIYVFGSGEARGIQIANSTNNYMVIKNNNIVMESVDAFPVYLNSVANLNLYDMDYNNMYAPFHVGYAQENKTTISDWQQTIFTDRHSVSIFPDFIDSSVSLELSDYTGLLCPFYQEIKGDIKGNIRSNITTLGAYNALVPSLDLGIEAIICNDTVIVYPQQVPVKIKIINTGKSIDVDSATFGWSVNGVVQPSYTLIASNPLTFGMNMETLVGSFNAGRSNVFDIVIWVESVNGRKDSVTWNDTAKTSVKALCIGDNLSILSIEPLVSDNVLCIEDYTTLKTVLINTGTSDYDFAANPVTFNVEVNNPKPYSLDTVISTGILQTEHKMVIELTDMFPIIAAGQYDIKIWMDRTNYITDDDTLLAYYVSGKFGLPLDEDFSDEIPLVFTSQGNTSHTWQVIQQGTGLDTAVVPQFGSGMLAFTGSAGSMTTLATRQMDLSQTIQPSLSFWYFHDTIPCEDYTDVRITIDGGTTYTTLLSLTKYDPVYGWKQYSMDLPSYAVNQCVILTFEAIENSRNGDITQYIDRILITAKQDIAVTEVLTSPLSVCDLENKEIKMVMSNLSFPVLDYTTHPVTLTLEVKETGQTFIFDTLLTGGSLVSFASDTITVATDFNFAVGTYTLKAYFSSVLDVDRNNDTLVMPIVINPALSVQVQSESVSNCLTGELVVHPSVILNNTGNMDLYNINVILQIDTGENNPAVYALFRETYTDTLLAGDNTTYIFTNSYTVPWNARYDVRAMVYLSCDSAMANATTMIPECVDTRDLRIISIDNPTGTTDNIGSSIQVRATLNNRSDGDIFNNIPVSFLVRNSQGVQITTFTENVTIGTLETVRHNFTTSYTVPTDSVYYVTVYLNSQDNYRDNDTMTIRRETNVGIETLASNVFVLGQNIPNPAKSTTRIDYSIPESGEVIFHVQSVSGQLLYSKTVEAASGKNSLELNTSTLAAGIYFYSIEYKGQRLVKRMSVQK